MTNEEAQQLIKRIKSNDKNALDILYNIYSKRIYKFAYGYLKTKEDAMDIVHDVFISFWGNRNRLREDTKLESYLFTVTKNTVISVFRKKISSHEYVDHLKKISVKDYSDTNRQIDYDLLNNYLQGLINRLPRQRKQVFTLSREMGISNKQIAEKLNISVKTVEDHITKALRFIKKNMEGYGFLAILFYELFI